jgi:hypothetical protein
MAVILMVRVPDLPSRPKTISIVPGEELLLLASEAAFENIDHFDFVLPIDSRNLWLCTQLLQSRELRRRAASKLELQICVATALAVHSDPWPVTLSPLPIESSRACAAVAVSRSQTSSGLPLTCLADWAAEKRAGLSLSSACLRESHNLGCSKYRTGIDGAHSARGADRSALPRLGARALGFPL